MPVYQLDSRIVFPPPTHAEENGLLAVGGDLSPERLVLAYSMGIFPWYGEDLPIMWHSPDPRMLLWADDLRVNRSLRKQIARRPYRIAVDSAFEAVMVACASAPRPDQDGTWITEEMVDAYSELHRRGLAHSFEAWEDDKLVGGLYGVSIGNCYFGESMFSHAPDASKIAFALAVRQMYRWGIDLIDCQVHTEHLARFGAQEVPRAFFLEELERRIHPKTRLGPWVLDSDLC